MSADVLAKKPNDEVKDRGLSARLPAEPPVSHFAFDGDSVFWQDHPADEMPQPPHPLKAARPKSENHDIII